MSILEKNIKLKIIDYLTKKNHHEIIVPEVTIGHKSSNTLYVRADIFALNGEIAIYEIKSEKDSLARLSNQLKNYALYANKVNLVIDKKFLNKLEDISNDIGIYIIDGEILKEVREATYKDIDEEYLTQYWLSNELKDFLYGYKGISKLTKLECIAYLKSILTKHQLYNATLYMLKNRYVSESDYIIKNKIFPKRNIQINSSLTSLKKLPFSVLMP